MPYNPHPYGAQAQNPYATAQAPPQGSPYPAGPPAPYGPPTPPYEPTPYATYIPPERTSSNVLSIVAFVLAFIALGLFPIVFGPAAIICGVIALRRGERLGKLATILGVAGLLLGFGFGILIAML